MESYDAILIGSGPNALVNAAYLTRAGWSVLLLEKNARPGGGVQTGELTAPGFRHDVYAGFLVLFAISQANADLGGELAERGLNMINSATPAGVSMPGGKAAVLTTEVEKNVAEAERLSPGDGHAWVRMLQNMGPYAGQVFSLLKSDLESREARETIRAMMLTGDGRLSPFAAEFLATSRDFLESTFRSEVWRALLAPWVLHSGHGPEDANSGFWTQIFGIGAQMAGLPVAKGGAEALVSSLCRLIRDRGGVIRTGVAAEQITIEGGRATGVRTSDGERYHARRAVIAGTTPDQLYLKLLAGEPDVPETLRTQASRYRYGHSVFIVHLALSRPPAWHDERLNNVTYTHICSGLDGVSRNYNETTRRLLAADPVIGAGTPTLLDPSRAPAGKAVMVLQALDAPFHVAGDAAGKIETGDGSWTDDLKNRYADRVIATAAKHIPNLKRSILARHVISPLDLAGYNPNWVQGDPYSGSHSIAQSFLLRPLVGQSGHRTPVPGLYQIGAATFPGLGVGGNSGYILAQQLLMTQTATA